jgi:general secretion pathway protein A
LKQRVALRCEIKPLPNIEETERYVKARLLVAGAARTDIFSPGAIDYIFRCAAGIPRQINNLCDNAMLAGYAAELQTISRAVIEEVADTFDMLPDARQGRLSSEEQEMPARIFNAQGRAELWSAGSTQATAVDEAVRGASTEHSSADDRREDDLEETHATPAPDVNDIGAAFRRWDVMGDR